MQTFILSIDVNGNGTKAQGYFNQGSGATVNVSTAAINMSANLPGDRLRVVRAGTAPPPHDTVFSSADNVPALTITHLDGDGVTVKGSAQVLTAGGGGAAITFTNTVWGDYFTIA